MGLTGRTDYRPDGGHRDGCRRDGYHGARVPAAVPLLGRPRVHCRGCWTSKINTLSSQTKKMATLKKTSFLLPSEQRPYRSCLLNLQCDTPDPGALKRPARGWARGDAHLHPVHWLVRSPLELLELEEKTYNGEYETFKSSKLLRLQLHALVLTHMHTPNGWQHHLWCQQLIRRDSQSHAHTLGAMWRTDCRVWTLNRPTSSHSSPNSARKQTV